MEFLIIVAVLLGIGAIAYFGFKKIGKKEYTGKAATPTPSPKKVNDNTTKKDVVN